MFLRCSPSCATPSRNLSRCAALRSPPSTIAPPRSTMCPPSGMVHLARTAGRLAWRGVAFMQGTRGDGVIKALYEGSMKNYVRCQVLDGFVSFLSLGAGQIRVGSRELARISSCAVSKCVHKYELGEFSTCAPARFTLCPVHGRVHSAATQHYCPFSVRLSIDLRDCSTHTCATLLHRRAATSRSAKMSSPPST
eukprot:SAG11_NODE_305_length_10996_cov_4.698082_4_plen_194_part_00